MAKLFLFVQLPPFTRRGILRWSWLLSLFCLEPCLAEEPAAKVDGEPIQVSEVEREIAIAYGNRRIASGAHEFLRATTLEQLIKRRLVLRWLSETKQAARSDEVELARRQLQTSLTGLGQTLEQYLIQQQLDEAGLKRSLAWQIGWQRYIDKQLNDKNLERYFEQHRRDFDGTEMHVAHILFKVDKAEDSESIEAARGRARQLLAQIQAGKISFAEAARAHSASASREQGGDIGWITRREPMPESFSRAAFALERLQVSDPAETAFGIHLIQCLDIKPGQKKLSDVRPEIEQAVMLYLFDWAADQVRSQIRIEYTAGFPHFLSGTETLDRPSK